MMTAAGRRRPRLTGPVHSHAQTLRASHRYLAVLLLVVVSFLFTAFAPAAPWSRGAGLLLQSATLTVALWTSRSGGLGARLAVVSLAVVLATLQLGTDGRALTAGVSALSGAFIVATIVVIAKGVLTAKEINEQTILGAVSIYLLLGMLFAFLYGADAVLRDGPFFAQGTDGTASTRVYFSFTTLTTVGYGDYAPATSVGRTLANVEALLGQLYLVTVIALLVSRMTPSRAGRRG
jgi:hypothetical protein